MDLISKSATREASESAARIVALTAVFLISTASLASAQNKPLTLQSAPSKARPAASWSLAGKWTYRSYRNEPEVMIGSDADKALALLFGEGVMTFATPSGSAITGTLDMGGGYVLDLSGTSSRQGTETAVHMVGLGRPGTPTQGWEYDYDGVLTMNWPNGIAQDPAIVGTVIRAKPHGNAPAGYVASFIAVKE